jgi:hypothetical protein
VAHTCNPTYKGGREQEDHSSKPAQANRLWDIISKKKKKPSQKRDGVAEGVGPEFKPHTTKKKKPYHQDAPIFNILGSSKLINAVAQQ